MIYSGERKSVRWQVCHRFAVVILQLSQVYYFVHPGFIGQAQGANISSVLLQSRLSYFAVDEERLERYPI